MTKGASTDIAFTPSVKAIQERLGSRQAYALVEDRGGWADRITSDIEDFIDQRDSLYLGTASADGRPYIQHRGGPKGFLKVLDEHTLAFADFSGNRQYISIGNLAKNDRAFIFLMDYTTPTRIKIWGRAEVVEAEGHLIQRVADPTYGGQPERVILFHVEALDANCRQHITQRFTQEEVDAQTMPLKERIQELEAEVQKLRSTSAKCQQQ